MKEEKQRGREREPRAPVLPENPTRYRGEDMRWLEGEKEEDFWFY